MSLTHTFNGVPLKLQKVEKYALMTFCVHHCYTQFFSLFYFFYMMLVHKRYGEMTIDPPNRGFYFQLEYNKNVFLYQKKTSILGDDDDRIFISNPKSITHPPSFGFCASVVTAGRPYDNRIWLRSGPGCGFLFCIKVLFALIGGNAKVLPIPQRHLK